MPTEPERLTIGPYKVERLIGSAGQTSVYRCTAPGSSRPVAVKLFPRRLTEDTAQAAQFRIEAEALKEISQHPGLVEILSAGIEADRPYLALEWVEGTSLDRLTKRRRLSLPEVFAVMKGICRALVYAHGKGRVHGGLTPRNVLVSPDFKSIKISDLGLAPFEAAASGSLTSTLSTGEIRLTALYYLAPEVLEGLPDPSPRTDLYSAGAIFHELLTGRAPGAKFNLPSQLDAEVPQEVDPLPLKALARKPEERYASALELLDEIERVEEELRLRLVAEIKGPTLSGYTPADQPGPAETRRSPLVYLALVFSALALLGLVGFLMMR